MVVSALKEWAAVCKGLEEGKQIILLRKGGIMERRQGFELRHNDFYIFPTYEHQSRVFLREEYVKDYDSILREGHSNNLNNIRLYARVVLVKETTNRKVVHNLYDFHIWNEKYINARMDYSPGKPMSILFLRIHKLKTDLHLALSPEQAGCKSWIDIHSLNMEDLLNNVGEPVLDDDIFNEKLMQLKEALNI